MGRITWKFAGIVFPAAVIVLTVNSARPIQTFMFLGASIIWANFSGYIEGALKFMRK